MGLLFVFLTVAGLLSETLAFPVVKEGQREDVVTRCLVEVLSKALSKPDSQLDQECKDILQTGIKHASLDKKSSDGAVEQEQVVRGQAEVQGGNGADVKDIEALLKSVGNKRETPEDERSQESWSVGDEKDVEREKRSSWRPGRFHQRRNKRGEEGEDDFDRSQESWGVDKRLQEKDEEDVEKRSSWRPGRFHQRRNKRGEEGEDDFDRSQESWGLDKRLQEEDEAEIEKRVSWRPRYQQRKHKRDEEPLGEEPEEERSQESWDVDKRNWNEVEEDRYKRIWKPTHRYHHKKKLQKRGDEDDDGERSQESWGLDDERDKRNWRPGRYHQRRQKRDEEFSAEARDEPEEERSQEYWDFDTGRDKREWRSGRYHQRRHKRDEELSEDAGDEPDEERSQEYWDFDTGRDKREWRSERHHQRRHKRDEELSEEPKEEPEGERSQESWGLDKRHGNEEEEEIEKRIWKPTHRYHHKKKLHKRDGGSSEEEETPEDYEEAGKGGNEALRYLAEKRNPWIYRGYYHPAWFKRSSDAVASGKMEELAKLLSYKINQLANHSNQNEPKSTTPQRTISPQEGKKLENLAAMDMELQKIAAKLHDRRE